MLTRSSAKADYILLTLYIHFRTIYPLAIYRQHRHGLKEANGTGHMKGSFLLSKTYLKPILVSFNAAGLILDRVIADAPKRAELKGQVSHSGKFSCPYCHCQATYDINIKKGVFWPASTRTAEFVARTMETNAQILQEWAHLKLTDKQRFGVKAKSVFLELPGFDFIEGIGIDYMHFHSLGTVKQMFGLTFRIPVSRLALCSHEAECKADIKIIGSLSDVQRQAQD